VIRRGEPDLLDPSGLKQIALGVVVLVQMLFLQFMHLQPTAKLAHMAIKRSNAERFMIEIDFVKLGTCKRLYDVCGVLKGEDCLRQAR
jgi:hypothetical protein